MSVVHPTQPSLMALRALELVIRTGSMTEAARRLFVTRPAVGQMIRKLERQLDTALVERRARGIVATAEGARIAGIAGDVFGRIETAARHLQRDLARHRVVCYCESSIAGTWLAPNWAAIQRQANEGWFVLRRFERNDEVPADAGIVLSSRRNLDGAWTADAIAPPAWVRVRHPRVDPGERWYARADDPEGGPFRARGTGAESVALAFAKAGLGGAALPLYAAMQALRAGSVCLHGVEPGRGEGAYLFRRSAERDGTAASLAATLLARAREDVEAYRRLAP